MLGPRSLLIAAALLALSGGSAVGQTIRGSLMDPTTGQAITTAAVKLLDQDGWTRASALSDGGGRYVLRAPGRGAYWLRVERIGYQPTETRPFVVSAADSLILDLTVLPEAAELEGITVTASRRQQKNYTAFLERRRFGWGRYLGPEELARRPVSRASQLLMGMPGVSFGNGTVRFTGRGSNCPPTVYVDGLRFAPEGGEMPVDLLVSGPQVRGVEVYTTPMFAPVELTGSRNGCGIVVFWTDYGLGI